MPAVESTFMAAVGTIAGITEEQLLDRRIERSTFNARDKLTSLPVSRHGHAGGSGGTVRNAAGRVSGAGAGFGADERLTWIAATASRIAAIESENFSKGQFCPLPER